MHLIDELGRLPGIGPKSAQRIAFHLLKIPEVDAHRLADAIREGAQCSSASVVSMLRSRRHAPSVPMSGIWPTLRVVEESRDIIAIERTGEFKGRYHVLLGARRILLRALGQTVQDSGTSRTAWPRAVTEVVICTNPNTEGRSPPCTSPACCHRSASPCLDLQVVSPSADIEYADELTLGQHSGRTRITESN